MDAYYKSILDNFKLDSQPIDCNCYGQGHINTTVLVSCASGSRYILQKINHEVFKDVAGLMANISAVTEYMRRQSSDSRSVMEFVKTRDGRDYIQHSDGSYWRVIIFVEDSICLQQPECPGDFYESAVAFGGFQHCLRDFPAESLRESIPHFHDTPRRYRAFKETLAADPCGRAGSVKKETEFVLSREREASTLVDMLNAGELPLRVTHNDTKLNNVLLDRTTRKALCVIDLDTVMPGLSLYDYGDAIRFGAATAGEEERELDKMGLDLELFETFTRGYISACPELTENERRMLPMGAKLMTLECGLRFLTDYLDGDNYFKCSCEGQNLDRARSQFKLVWDMEQKWQKMNEIVRSIK